MTENVPLDLAILTARSMSQADTDPAEEVLCLWVPGTCRLHNNRTELDPFSQAPVLILPPLLVAPQGQSVTRLLRSPLDSECLQRIYHTNIQSGMQTPLEVLQHDVCWPPLGVGEEGPVLLSGSQVST